MDRQQNDQQKSIENRERKFGVKGLHIFNEECGNLTRWASICLYLFFLFCRDIHICLFIYRLKSGNKMSDMWQEIQSYVNREHD